MAKIKQCEKSPLARIWRTRHSHAELLGEMAASRAEAEKIDKEDHSVSESKDLSKHGGGMPKGHRSQLEEAPTGQSWDNLSFKISKDHKIKEEFVSLN